MTAARRFRCVPARPNVSEARTRSGRRSCTSATSRSSDGPQLDVFYEDLSVDLVARCTVLHEAVSNAGEGSVVDLVLPTGANSAFFAAWLKFARAEASSRMLLHRSMPMDDVLSGLRAASFLGDQEALRGLSSVLAQHMFHTPDMLMPANNKRMRDEVHGQSWREAQRAANEQVVTNLEKPTAQLTLQSDNVALLHCIRGLPATLHSLVIEAQHPSATKDHSISLTDPDSGVCSKADSLEVLQALSAFTQLTALRLSKPWMSWVGVCDAEEQGVIGEGCQATMNQFSELLTSLRSLKQLCFTHGMHAVAAKVLTKSAPRMKSLVCLQLTGGGHELAASEMLELVKGMQKLSGLKAVSLSGMFVHDPHACDASPADSEEEDVSDGSYESSSIVVNKELIASDAFAFCSELQKLTALTSLSLKHIIDLPKVSIDERDGDVNNGGDGSGERNLVAVTKQGLGAALEALVSLQRLVLDETVVMFGIAPAFGSIAKLTRLTSLLLRCDVSGGEEEHVHVDHTSSHLRDFQFMLQNVPQLKDLEVSGYIFCENAQMKAVCTLTCLTRLSLCGFIDRQETSVSDGFWSILGHSVKSIVNLQFFAMQQFDFYERCGEISGSKGSELGDLLEGLATLRSLVDLKIVNCEVERKGAKCLAMHLRSFSVLTSLTLDLQLQESLRGAKAIRRSVRKMAYLKVADVLLV